MKKFFQKNTASCSGSWDESAFASADPQNDTGSSCGFAPNGKRQTSARRRGASDRPRFRYSYLVESAVMLYGAEILFSPRMQLEKDFIQHGNVSVFEHSVHVACMCLWFAGFLRFLHVVLHYEDLVRGALLHDYFLYDWHVPEDWHRMHGFTHAAKALANASEDFQLNETQRDIILKHMFPLNLSPPACPESALVCVADKICSVEETVSYPLSVVASCFHGKEML